jgi:hypothetical protein
MKFMTELHRLDPVTLDFFDSAPLRVQCTMLAKCSPERLFETLRGDTVWTEWAAVIEGVQWTSDKPYAKNATRDVSLLGGMMVRELFFHWEENERIAFYVTESTIPKLSKFAEDYRVERVGLDQTKLTWTVAIENQGLMRHLNAITAPVMKLVFQSWLKKYKKILETPVPKPAAQPSAGAQPRA